MHFPHADAGKYEADLRARGYVVTDVAYGTDVVLTVAIKPSEEEALGAYALALTRGAVVPEFYSTMWVELPA